MIRGRGLLAAVLFPLAVLAAVYGLLVPHGPSGGQVVYAQFADAALLVPGDDVETGGTRIGTVSAVQLADRGTALVTMHVSSAVPVHADASASVQQADVLGDVYLALDPGTVDRPLRGQIAASRTFDGTQLQDVFDAFNAPTRSALQTLIVELGTALNARGADLNQAVLELAPAITEVNRIAGQLSTQNANLDGLITNAQGLTAQLAPRSQDIGRLIDGFDRTVRITAGRTPALNTGLENLPATLGQTQTTLRALTATATAATPLATQLSSIVPALGSAVSEIRPFAARATPALAQLGPLLTLAATTLTGGARAISRLGTAVSTLTSITPPLERLSSILYPVITIGLKGIYGGLGGLGAEPGSGGRNEFRAQLVLGCEIFGVPTHPGCLTQILDSVLPQGSATQRRAHSPRPTRPGTASTQQPPTVPTPSATGTPPSTPTAGEQLPQTLSKVLQTLGGVVDGVTHPGSTTPVPTGQGQSGQGGSLNQLLHYLLGR